MNHGAGSNNSNLQVLDALSQLGELEEQLHILLLLISLIHGHLKDLSSLGPQDHLLG